MIARVWTAAATPANAATYREHFAQHVLPALRAVEGHRGAVLLQRDAGELLELLVITRWDDRVRHYEVVIE